MVSSASRQLASALNNQANALHAQGHSLQALELFDRALALEPDFVEAYSNRGNALRRLKRFNDAMASYDAAIALRPDYGPAHNNLGLVWQELGDYEAAIACHDRALAIDPRNAFAHNNRGRALRAILRLDEALTSYNHALSCKPDFTEALWNKAVVLLTQGDYEHGWRLYESRRINTQAFGPPESFGAVDWRGDQSLDGKTLLIHNEQGLGDSIQFCRYAGMLADRGALVVLRVQPHLSTLMKSLAGVSHVLTPEDTLPPVDFQCPLPSLPFSMGTRLDTVPAPTPYLHPSPSAITEWTSRLGAARKPRLGLVWRGNPLHTNDHNRSIALTDLLPILSETVDWISLQQDLLEHEPDLLQRHGVMALGQALRDFDDTAAICQQLDGVISVDTSVAHLAGALAVRTFLLLPFAPDYRWLIDRKDTPWYPTMTLLRQMRAGDWNGPLSELKALTRSITK